jgi:hypothetical protein
MGASSRGALLLVCTLVGCSGPVECTDGTAFLALAYDPASSLADQIKLRVSVGGTSGDFTLSRAAGALSDSVEVHFRSGYPHGQVLTVAATALLRGAPIGAGSTTSPLEGTCATVGIALVGAAGADAAARDGALDLAVDGARAKDAGADLARVVDLSAVDQSGADQSGADLAVVDLATADLVPPCPPTIALTDDFNGAMLDTNKWTPLPGVAGQVAQMNMQLVTTCAVNTAADYPSVISAQTWDITGSSFYVEVVQLTNDIIGANIFVKAMRQDYQSAFEIAGRPSALIVNHEIAGSWSQVALLQPYPMGARYLRIREAQGSLYAEYAATPRGPWTTVGAAPNPFDVRATIVSFGVATIPAIPNPGVGIFDNFDICP